MLVNGLIVKHVAMVFVGELTLKIRTNPELSPKLLNVPPTFAEVKIPAVLQVIVIEVPEVALGVNVIEFDK